MSKGLSESDKKFLDKQEELLKEVISTIKSTPLENRVDIREVAENIRNLNEEIKVGKEDDLPGLYYQLNIQHQLAERYSKPIEIPDLESPYFGYMKLVEGKKEKIILLGHKSYLPAKARFRIVDWKKAPIAQIFYQYDEGEEFELSLGDRELGGIVAEHCVLTIEKGIIQRVDRAGITFCKSDDGWLSLEEGVMKLAGGEGSATRTLGTGLTGFKGPEVAGLLDKTQYELLGRDVHEPLLIIGGAGSGKTTVALHRIAALVEKKKVYPNQVLVLVPNEGLIRLSKKLLHDIGLRQVKIRAAKDWIKDQAYKMLPDLPKLLCTTTPLSVNIVKKHLSFKNLMDKYLKTYEDELLQKLKSLSNEAVDIFKNHSDKPFIHRLYLIEKNVNLTAIQKIKIKDEKIQIFNVREDLLRILTDKKLMKELITLSRGVITESMLEATRLHTARQMHRRDTMDYSNKTLDGKTLDESTSFDVSETIDEEDFPLLLKLLEMKTGEIATPYGKIKQFHHLVLDEAQELAPVELNVFSRALDEKGNVTVAGDAAQQVDPTISFTSWSDVLHHLNAEQVQAHELTISYRSPQSIIDFAHGLLGENAPSEKPTATRSGAPVRLDKLPHRAQGSLLIYEAINDLMIREPKASVAIICNKLKTAELFYEELKELEKVRLIEEADFNFKPGIDITTVEQIRGLEFDYVIIPDADKINYPDNPRTRKRLYLAATRAIHQLWIMYTGDKSPILPALN